MSQDAAGGNQEPEQVEEPTPEPDQAEAAQDAEAEEIDEVEALRAQAEQNWNKYLRVAAELENLRKRAARDVESARKRGLEQLALALLPVRDSLEAGVAVADQSDVDALLEGKRATLRLLDQALDAVGIEELDPEGEPFDPEKHEAMTLQPSDQMEPGSVLTVIQKGYQVHGRLLRPARVIVSQAPPEESAADEAAE